MTASLAWLANVAAELAGSVLIFAAGYSLARLRDLLQRRFNPFRTLSPLGSVKKVSICYGVIPGEGRSYVAEEGDVVTLCSLVDVMRLMIGRAGVELVSSDSVMRSPQYFHSILCASGPAWNKVTEKLIGDLGSPVSFSRAHRCIICGRKRYQTVRTPPSLARRCHGIVVAGTTEDGKNVMVCAGNTTLSTFGVAVFLKRLYTTPRLVRELREKGIVPGKRWGILVEVTNRLPADRTGPNTLPHEELVDIRIVRCFPDSEFSLRYRYLYEDS